MRIFLLRAQTTRPGDSDQFGAAQKLDCRAGLLSIICDDRTNQHVRVNRELHFLPAQAVALASLISSIVAIFLVRPASKPTNPSIVPAGLAAFSMPRPSGKKSTSILSPGWRSRCCSTSLRNVTWPRAMMVMVLIVCSLKFRVADSW